jgi:hypothetical protein
VVAVVAVVAVSAWPAEGTLLRDASATCLPCTLSGLSRFPESDFFLMTESPLALPAA